MAGREGLSLVSAGPSLDESAMPGASRLAGSKSLPPGLNPSSQMCPSSPVLAAGMCGRAGSTVHSLLSCSSPQLGCPVLQDPGPHPAVRVAPACPLGLDAAPSTHPAAQGKVCVHAGLWRRAGHGLAAVRAGRACSCVRAALVSCKVLCPVSSWHILAPLPALRACQAGMGWSCVRHSLGPRELAGDIAERLSSWWGPSHEHPMVSGRPGSPLLPTITLPEDRSLVVAESPSRAGWHGQPRPQSSPKQPRRLPCSLSLPQPSPFPTEYSAASH